MVLSVLLALVGLVLLLVGADALVRGARSLALRLGISPLVVGLTVVAFGTSAPELFVSSAAALQGSPSVAIGNVVGSNIFNILVIIGVAAIILPVHISTSITRREMPIMLLALGLFWFMSADHLLSRFEGVMLVCGLGLYLAYHFLMLRRGVQNEIIEEVTAELEVPESSALLASLLVAVGLVGLVLGSEMAVDHSTLVARQLGISEFIIGVTLIAVGTSLPELATTSIAAFKGEPDLAVGNAVGSNIFNCLAVIGVTACLAPITVASSPLQLDYPAMFLSALLVWPLMILNRRMRWPAGTLLVLMYASYMTATVYFGS